MNIKPARPWFLAFSFLPLCAAVLALAAPLPALAEASCQAVDATTLQKANEIYYAEQRLARYGYAGILVSVDESGPPPAAVSDPRISKITNDPYLAALLQQLGGHVLLGTVHISQPGLVRLHVDREGGGVILTSPLVWKWSLDSNQALRTGITDRYQEVAVLESRIAAEGSAKVEVSLNLEELGADDGEADYAPGTAKAAEFHTKALAFLDAVVPSGFLNLAEVRQDIQSGRLTGPVLPLTVNMEGLWLLREHRDVRALHAMPFTPPPMAFDIAALEQARDRGLATVVFNLRPPRHYSALEPKLPEKAAQAQRAWVDNYQHQVAAEIAPTAKNISWGDGSPSMSLTLDYDGLHRLFRYPDPRVASVSLYPSVGLGASAN